MLHLAATEAALAGGALAPGLDLVDAGRRRAGHAVIAIACLALLLGVLATAIPAVDED